MGYYFNPKTTGGGLNQDYAHLIACHSECDEAKFTLSCIEHMKEKYSNMASSVYGIDATNKELVETSFKRLIDLLENHLIKFPYLFGGRPSIADFGLWGQLYASWMDITARNFINQRPNLVNWLKKMENPMIEGDFVGWSDDVKVDHYVEIKSFGCHFKVTQLDDWVKAVKEQKNL